MKVCDICHHDLPINSFGNNRSNKDGLHSTCKSCKNRLDKEYRKRNKDIIKERKHNYYLEHKDEIIRKTTQCIVNNRERVRLYSRKSRLKLKQEVFAHYCGSNDVKCNGCPETNIHLLTIDHINGDGSKHRLEFGNKSFGGHTLYRWLRNHDYPDGFQVLCMTCQYRKRMSEMKPINPTEKQNEKAAKVQELKVECLSHYGSVCPCGETELVLLTLDHVNDDGANHRKETGVRGYGFYIYLKKHDFPNDPPLQVLCIKCQFLKRAEAEQQIADGNQQIVEQKKGLADEPFQSENKVGFVEMQPTLSLLWERA